MTVKKIPMRMCVGCHEMKPKKELIRIVKTPEGEAKLDFTGKLNGRGAYICKNADCFKKAKKQNALSRAFSNPVLPEVYDTLEKALEQGNE